MKCIRIVMLALFFVHSPVQASSELVFAQIVNTPDQRVGAQIIEAAYAKLGYTVRTVEMPGKRALKESSSGRLDGEVHRIFEIADEYTSLVRVPTPLNYIESAVFTRDQDFTVTDCQALDAYAVGIVGGVKHAEICVVGLRDVQVFGTSEKMMKLLNLGRIQLAITAKVNGQVLVSQMKLSGIKPLSPALRKMPVYHYLHRKHRDLVPQIDAVFQEMQRSGELEQLRQQAVQEQLEQ
ncbi:MAG: substrate-binding periplasmic protein [Pseudomonadales bacterium]